MALAAAHGVPVVATNDVRFLAADEFEAHEARVCIQDGALLADPARPRRYTRQQYLRSPAEMAALFADLPEALANTRGDRAPLQPGADARRGAPAGVPGAGRHQHRGVPARAGRARPGRAPLVAPPARRAPRYRERLASELDVICQMGFAGYFLIVADFIRWARENGVPVGPGRGSGAGSLVAYALGHHRPRSARSTTCCSSAS